MVFWVYLERLNCLKWILLLGIVATSSVTRCSAISKCLNYSTMGMAIRRVSGTGCSMNPRHAVGGEIHYGLAHSQSDAGTV